MRTNIENFVLPLLHPPFCVLINDSAFSYGFLDDGGGVYVYLNSMVVQFHIIISQSKRKPLRHTKPKVITLLIQAFLYSTVTGTRCLFFDGINFIVLCNKFSGLTLHLIFSRELVFTCFGYCICCLAFISKE